MEKLKYNDYCGFYGCELSHQQEKANDMELLMRLANIGEKYCTSVIYQHRNPCGKTQFDDVCACGCDASGWRCNEDYSDTWLGGINE